MLERQSITDVGELPRASLIRTIYAKVYLADELKFKSIQAWKRLKIWVLGNS